jgi:hypothetical protein
VGCIRSRDGARGGDDIPPLRRAGPRIVTGAASVAGLLALAAIPLSRGTTTLREIGVRVVEVALVALVAALAQGRPVLVPFSITLVGGLYAAELVVDDAPLDASAAAVAAGLFLTAELAYWSLDSRDGLVGEAGEGLRRTAHVALAGIAAFVVSALLLVVVDAIRVHGLPVDVLGALAAVGVVATVVFLAGAQDRSGS